MAIPLDLDINVKGAKSIGEIRENIGEINKELENTKIGSKRFDELSTSLRESNKELGDANDLVKTGGKEFESFGDTAKKGLGGASQATDLLASSNEQLAGVLGQGQVALKATAGASALVTSGLKANVGVLKLFKVALAATGIGAIVVALGALIAFFTKTQRGIEIVNKASAALEATMGVLVDRLSALGETLFNAFNDPQAAIKDFSKTLKTFVSDRIDALFESVGLVGKALASLFKGDFAEALEVGKQALLKLDEGTLNLVGNTKDAIDAIAGLVDEIDREATSASDLAGRQDALIKRERLLNVERAQSRARIEELKFISEDVTQTEEKRLEAAREAFAIEKDLVNKSVALGQEKVDIIKAQLALGESTEEDLQKQADAEIALADVRAESATKQIELNNKINSIEAEGVANREASRAKEQEETDKQLDLDFEKRSNEIQLRRLQAEEDIALRLEVLTAQRALEIEFFKGTEEELAILKEEFNQRTNALEKKQTDTEVLEAKKRKVALVSSALAAAGSLLSIGELLVKEGKKGERLKKNLALAQIAIDTGVALAGIVAQASTNPANLAPPLLVADIAFRSIAVLTNIAKAKRALNSSSTPTGGAAGGGAAPDVGGGSSIEIERVRATALTEDGTPEPAKAFVVETDLSKTQKRVRGLETNAKIG